METFTGLSGTVLGPLTTAWSMPDACTVYVPACATCTKAYRGQQCKGTVAGSDGADCWPPVTVRETPKSNFFGWGFYSPGLACPTGYTSACTAQYGGRAEWEIQFTLVPGETAVGCCPQYVGNHVQTWKSWLTVSGASGVQTGVAAILASQLLLREPKWSLQRACARGPG